MSLQIAWDDAQKLTNRRLEREKGRNDAAEDLSELSEGEKEKGDANQPESITTDKISRTNSDMQIWLDDDKSTSKRLYIVLIRCLKLSVMPPTVSRYKVHICDTKC